MKHESRSKAGRTLCGWVLAGAFLALALSGVFGAAAAGATPYTRHLKMQLLAAHRGAPELVIYGGSRAEKAEPGYFEYLTGISGFNVAVIPCRPSDVLAYSQYLHDLAPHQRQSPVWILSMETFRDNGFFQGELLSMPELLAELPADLTCADGTVWSPDGYLLVSRYEVMLAEGVSREKLTATRLKIYLDSYHDWGALSARAAQVVETTIARMNRWRWRPVIVLPPYHPYVLAAIRPLDPTVPYAGAAQRKV